MHELIKRFNDMYAHVKHLIAIIFFLLFFEYNKQIIKTITVQKDSKYIEKAIVSSAKKEKYPYFITFSIGSAIFIPNTKRKLYNNNPNIRKIKSEKSNDVYLSFINNNIFFSYVPLLIT